MRQHYEKLIQVMNSMIGLHRQLHDLVKQEKAALTQANKKALEEVVYAKTALIEQIRQAESDRLKVAVELSLGLKKPIQELTLSQVVLESQGVYPELSERLQTLLNTLRVLVQRTLEQNQYNQSIVEKSLNHIHEMKSNVLQSSQPLHQTYSSQGHKQVQTNQARILSTEI
jgi:flagellar biosynthesis/type III secretory pathway chaperone